MIAHNPLRGSGRADFPGQMCSSTFDLGNPAVRHFRGASGNVARVEMRSRLAYRKSETGNPPPTAGAPELYPDAKPAEFIQP
jgi:hypothetical protein